MTIKDLIYPLKILFQSMRERGLRRTIYLSFSKLKGGTLRQVIASKANYERDYRLWRKENWPSPEDYEALKERIEAFESRPLISVIMPVYETPEAFLRQAIDSVIEQIYPNWELCIADDNSNQPYIRQLLQEYQATDSRIKVEFRDKNGHISAASNSALGLANGEYVTFLDHDDLITPDALFEIAALVNRHPCADLIYSDEDKLDQSGNPITPYFKPDWSPDNLLSRMYTLHLSVYRRTIVEELGGLRPGFEGSQDHDLALRFVEKTDAIYHIPKILYHWRVHPDSTAHGASKKDYASEAGRKAVAESLVRRGEPGTVTFDPDHPGVYNVRYDIREEAPVSIIIPTRDLADTLDACLTSIFSKTTYKNFEVLQVDNGSKKDETARVFAKWQKLEPERYRLESYDAPFNFSKINNYAAKRAEGRYLLFLNNDTRVISDDWLCGLLEQAQRKSIGAVGAKLLYPNGCIQHAGLILGLGDFKTAGHVFQGYSNDAGGYYSNLRAITNYSAITGACLMCKKDDFVAVEGFDESLGIAYNDVDFCLKLRQRGLYNVCLPHVQLFHDESKSRGYEHSAEKRARLEEEAKILRSKWGTVLDNDPCYNPNLSKNSNDFRINLN